ncbi:stage II sporulation protein M [Paenibacillus larvae]|uniref:Integral membrane protein n=1 Tax=Paenibacillus larvae subsp. larvae TaxID=147375 RepID=A0A6C0QMN6_9BACL|nr:stage II sporulation protein M [Paenibacillus larvae]QHZ49496.1 integral membrane protein [Paenibacillus larvae subsp. larvae]
MKQVNENKSKCYQVTHCLEPKKWIQKKITLGLFISSGCIFFLSFLLGSLFSSNFSVNIDHNLILSSDPSYYIIHNLKSSLYMIGGLFSFSLTTLWALFINGYYLGVTFTSIGELYSYGIAIGSIAVHGAFEIPAILLASATGLYPWYFIYCFLKNKKIVYKQHLKNSVSMLVISVILFILAGIMEAKISPLFVQ